MFISDETFARLHQELMLEHKAKLRMITDNNKLLRVLQEIKAIVEKNITYQDTDSTTKAMAKILDLITKVEEY